MFTGPLPKQVNLRKFAVENRKLEGAVSLADFTRLTQSLESSTGEVKLKLEFRMGRKQRVLLVGHAIADVKLQCQRCLSPMSYTLDARIRHFVVNTEEALHKLALEDDAILCLEEKISLVNIFEDELIIGLPMVARHNLASNDASDDGHCEKENGQSQEAPAHQNDDSPVMGETHRPFAALADIKNDFKRS